MESALSEESLARESECTFSVLQLAFQTELCSVLQREAGLAQSNADISVMGAETSAWCAEMSAGVFKANSVVMSNLVQRVGESLIA